MLVDGFGAKDTISLIEPWAIPAVDHDEFCWVQKYCNSFGHSAPSGSMPLPPLQLLELPAAASQRECVGIPASWNFFGIE